MVGDLSEEHDRELVGEGTVSGSAAGLTGGTIPGHLREGEGETAPAGAARKSEPRSKKGTKQNPVGIHGQSENRSGEDADPDRELNLLHERKTLFPTAVDRQSGRFPGEDSALQIPDVCHSRGLQFLHCLLTALSAPTHHHHRGTAIYFREAIFQLPERDQIRTGNVFFGMLDRLTHIDETAVGGEQGMEFGGMDIGKDGVHGDVVLISLYDYSVIFQPNFSQIKEFPLQPPLPNSFSCPGPARPQLR
jgi:hypothetical protein